ncbi:MAG: hypothetical protein QOH21_372 [Acidobacteriota bacterium]|jgi:peptidoglycan/xylan/chitin deacetylase (PgdA/CDA1 family)|nr:hypothetical protein [Acidobacteriota bacterium]
MTASLVFTVDTEPDDQWAPPLPDGTLPPFGFANTRGLGRLIDVFHAAGLPVTWMTSWSVARDEESTRLLRDAAADGDEIAGHLHGWETPPFLPCDARHRPFIAEYDPAMRLAKHRELLAAHAEAFGAQPVSYRAGRWGVDAQELAHLAELGYRIDTSIPPGIDFRDRFGMHIAGPDFSAYASDAPRPWREEPLWEVPASVVRLEPGRFVWIRPLKHPRAELVEATHALLERGAPIVNVMFHSSEAFLDTSPLSRTVMDVERLYGDLAAIAGAAREHGAVGRTLRDAVEAL